MNVKNMFLRIDILEWVSLICTFALLSCVCVLEWNALSPAKTKILQPEILFVITLLLSGIWIDKRRRVERILPFVGMILVFAGLVALMYDNKWSKLLLCMGMGPVLCVKLYRLWRQVRVTTFIYAICCGAAVGILLAAIPMILNNYQIWPLLTSGLAVGITVGFLRPYKAITKDKESINSHKTVRNQASLSLPILAIWALSSLGTGVSYKWFFLSVPWPAIIYVVLLCAGICATGILLLRLDFSYALNSYMVMLIVFNVMQLVMHSDTPFANATSYVLFGMYFAGFLFFPALLWREEMNAFRGSVGLSLGFICLIAIPRTLGLIAPQSWLFETKLGWMLQTICLVLLFFAFCRINRTLLSAAYEPLPVPAIPENDMRNPLPDYFTKREYEVAKLILQGKTNREISLSLNIAESTVKTHIGNLLGKTQCSTKSQFIAAYRP